MSARSDFEQLKERLVRRCQTELERRRPASFVPLSVILSAMNRHASPPVLDALLDDDDRKAASWCGAEIASDCPRVPELSNRQRDMLTTLLAEVSAAGPTPPTLKEFAERHGYSLKDLEPLVQVAVDEGQLVRVSPQLVMDRDALESVATAPGRAFQQITDGQGRRNSRAMGHHSQARRADFRVLRSVPDHFAGGRHSFGGPAHVGAG